MSRWQDKITRDQYNTEPQTFVGIDVGKRQLDVFIYPHGCSMQIENNAQSIKKLIQELESYAIECVAVEATGKFHNLVHGMLHHAGIPVAVVNPFRSRKFADSMGQLAKTDSIDAEMLARFAQRMEPSITPPQDHVLKELHELHIARRQVSDEISDLKRRLQTADNAVVKRQIQSRINLGEKHKATLDIAIKNVIETSPALKEKFDILTSIPNIGKITAAIMLADLNELGDANARQIAALAGVAPMNHDSGMKNGNRIIRGGRKPVRNALYMCAVSAIRRNDLFGFYYQRLIKRGKNPKVALTAVMRKLVIVANTLITENRQWRDQAINV